MNIRSVVVVVVESDPDVIESEGSRILSLSKLSTRFSRCTSSLSLSLSFSFNLFQSRDPRTRKGDENFSSEKKRSNCQREKYNSFEFFESNRRIFLGKSSGEMLKFFEFSKSKQLSRMESLRCGFEILKNF